MSDPKLLRPQGAEKGSDKIEDFIPPKPDWNKDISADEQRLFFQQQRTRSGEDTRNVPAVTLKDNKDKKSDDNELSPEELKLLQKKPQADKQPNKEPDQKTDQKAKADVPRVDGERSDKAAPAKVGDARKLEGDEAARAQLLQQNLINTAARYVDVITKDPEVATRSVKAVTDGIEEERRAGVFGPATQQAYRRYIDWMEKQAVPQTVREMDMMRLEVPAGCPIELPADAYQRSIHPDLYKVGDLKMNMGIDATKVPSEADMDKLDDVVGWLGKCNTRVVESRGQAMDRQLNKLIEENGFPDAWKRKDGQDAVAWRASAEEMVDLSVRTKNYVEAMQSLYKSSRDKDSKEDAFPFALPVGCKIVIESGGKTREITDQEVNDPRVRQLLADAKIKEVILAVPKDLRQEDPANAEKIANLRNWLGEYGDKIDKGVAAMVDLQKNVDAVIMYGDIEVAKGKGLFNSKNQFIGLTDDKYQPKEGETKRDLNLLGYDFNVQKVTDKNDPNFGKYKVTQTINAESAPWYAYQNCRQMGVEKIGESMDVATKYLDADAFVPVRDGSKIQLVKAKNLDSFKTNQQGWYWGEKVVIGALDGVMAVEAAVTLGTATVGYFAAKEALKLTAKQFAMELGKGALRLTVAGAGILNNAGARDTEWGRTANTVRGLYFLGDMGLATGANAWRAGRSVLGLAKGAETAEAAAALTGAQKVNTILHGGMVNGEKVKAAAYWGKFHTGLEYGFRATEAGFVPIIARDYLHELDRLGGKTRSFGFDAATQVGDGRGMQVAKAGDFDTKKPEVAKATNAVLDGYSETLQQGRPDQTKREVQGIFDTTKRLLAPDATEDEKTAYRQKLSASLNFTGDQIRDLEKAHEMTYKTVTLSPAQLLELTQADKRKDYEKPVRDLAEKFLSERNKDVDAASRIALLYLSRNADGKLQPQAGAVKLEVPEYKKIVGDGEYMREETVKARTVTLTSETKDVVACLKQDLGSSAGTNRGIVTGDCLVRIGGITHQEFGAQLQDVLEDKSSTKADKMRALSDRSGARLATIIDGLRYQEADKGNRNPVDALREKGKSFGVTADDLARTLVATAKTDADPDVRAMSGALLYGLKEADPNRRSALLNAFNMEWQKSGGTDGAFAKRLNEFLTTQMKEQIPAEAKSADAVRDSRINAAVSMSYLSADAGVQKDITKALVESISSTSPVVALKALDALLPERFAQIAKENPELANQVRERSLSLVKLPRTREEETLTARLISNMEPLLREGEPELRRKFVDKLHGFLWNSKANNEYAKFYPSLRAASIDSLGALGEQRSFELILSHASAQPIVKLGDKAVVAAEQDATVRLSAVRALEKLQPAKNEANPKLRNLVHDLVNNEKDATVAYQLRDFHFTMQRIEPGSDEYKRMYESTRIKLTPLTDKHPKLAGFNDDAIKNWLRTDPRFSMLDEDAFRETAQNAALGAMGGFNRFFSFTETIKAREWEKANEVEVKRRDQWKDLCDLAKTDGEDGDKAKLALLHIATHDGSILGGKSGLNIHIKGNAMDQNFYNFDWKRMASREFKELAKSGNGSRDIVDYCLQTGLALSAQLPGYVSVDFLDGWREMSKGQTDTREREKFARVTGQALEAELSRQENQTDYFQMELIKDLKDYGDRRVFPVLDAMQSSSKFESVRKECKQQMSDFYSVALQWNDARVDQVASPKERAARMKDALDDSNNGETAAGAIARAYKGYRIKNESDPGLAMIQLGMNDNNARTRFMSAKVIMESELAQDAPVRLKAAEVFANLVVNGPQIAKAHEIQIARCKADAYQELSRFALTAPMTVATAGGGQYRIQRNQAGVVEVTKVK